MRHEGFAGTYLIPRGETVFPSIFTYYSEHIQSSMSGEAAVMSRIMKFQLTKDYTGDSGPI